MSAVLNVMAQHSHRQQLHNVGCTLTTVFDFKKNMFCRFTTQCLYNIHFDSTVLAQFKVLQGNVDIAFSFTKNGL